MPLTNLSCLEFMHMERSSLILSIIIGCISYTELFYHVELARTGFHGHWMEHSHIFGEHNESEFKQISHDFTVDRYTGGYIGYFVCGFLVGLFWNLWNYFNPNRQIRWKPLPFIQIGAFIIFCTSVGYFLPILGFEGIWWFGKARLFIGLGCSITCTYSVVYLYGISRNSRHPDQHKLLGMMTPMAVLGELLGFFIGSIAKNEVWLVMHVIGALIIILPMIFTCFPIVTNYEKDAQDEVEEPNEGIQANVSLQESAALPINETLGKGIYDDHTNIKLEISNLPSTSHERSNEQTLLQVQTIDVFEMINSDDVNNQNSDFSDQPSTNAESSEQVSIKPPTSNVFFNPTSDENLHNQISEISDPPATEYSISNEPLIDPNNADLDANSHDNLLDHILNEKLLWKKCVKFAFRLCISICLILFGPSCGYTWNILTDEIYEYFGLEEKDTIFSKYVSTIGKMVVSTIFILFVHWKPQNKLIGATVVNILILIFIMILFVTTKDFPAKEFLGYPAFIMTITSILHICVTAVVIESIGEILPHLFSKNEVLMGWSLTVGIQFYLINKILVWLEDIKELFSKDNVWIPFSLVLLLQFVFLTSVWLLFWCPQVRTIAIHHDEDHQHQHSQIPTNPRNSLHE